jgi:asparagine synthase (glutamine-hydrolysing)
MCGIVGFWPANKGVISTQDFDRFTDSLAHRGPDGRGTHLDEKSGIYLGHRRLSVLDLSLSGSQPMSYGDRRYWIVHNGEIYNFLELQKELEGLGHMFRSSSDTEVILAAYAEWGVECQHRLNGMWAFAIWDSIAQELFLSRDRFGVKPLFFLNDGTSFIFASELKAFMMLPRRFRPGFDHGMIARMKNEASQTKTILNGVRNLKGGHCLIYKSNGSPRITQWWETYDHLVCPPKGFDEQVEQYRDLFLESCKIRMRSDVPLGTALSGGLDSSSVICSMAKIRSGNVNEERLSNDWKKAFSLVYSGTSHDERKYADLVADATNTDISHKIIHPHSIAPDDVISAVFSLEAIDNEPTIGPWLLYKEMKNQGVVVSLDGHGGDETLAGYQHYPSVAMRDALWPIPDWQKWKDMQETLRGIYMDESPLNAKYKRPTVQGTLLDILPNISALREFIADQVSRYPNIYQRTRNLRDYIYKKEQSSSDTDWLRIRPARERVANVYSATNRRRKFDALNMQLYFDTHHGSLPRNLTDFDRLSMAHGVEVRAPFMDWRLMRFVFSLPSESKIGQGYTKRVLREAMRGTLPEIIRMRRSKFGFASPMAEWYKSGLKEFVLDTVGSMAFLESEIWYGQNIKEYTERCFRQNAYQEATRTWKFIQADILQRTFHESAQILK